MMPDRHDASLAAAELALLVERAAMSSGQCVCVSDGWVGGVGLQQ